MVPGIAWAHRSGLLLDKPDSRKRHQTPTPMIGGIIIFLGICLTCLLYTSDAADE